jgi:hypothetical protein
VTDDSRDLDAKSDSVPDAESIDLAGSVEVGAAFLFLFREGIFGTTGTMG